MQNQDVLDRSAPTATTPTASPVDDVLAETLGNLMLWLIPVLAFLLAILR